MNIDKPPPPPQRVRLTIEGNDMAGLRRLLKRLLRSLALICQCQKFRLAMRSDRNIES